VANSFFFFFLKAMIADQALLKVLVDLIALALEAPVCRFAQNEKSTSKNSLIV
jgi:hypothetical protein